MTTWLGHMLPRYLVRRYSRYSWEDVSEGDWFAKLSRDDGLPLYDWPLSSSQRPEELKGQSSLSEREVSLPSPLNWGLSFSWIWTCQSSEYNCTSSLPGPPVDPWATLVLYHWHLVPSLQVLGFISFHHVMDQCLTVCLWVHIQRHLHAPAYTHTQPIGSIFVENNYKYKF